MNTPNKLTVARMILVPFLVVFLLTGWGGEANRWICLAIFVAASVTDWFDGHLARKYNLITNFGKFMDPLADKLLVCSAMICMIEVDKLPAWVVIIIIGREFIISGFRLIAAENGIVIAANYWGKFKTVSQMIMIILLMLDFGGVFAVLTQIFIWLSVALTIISLLTYIMQNRKVDFQCRSRDQSIRKEFLFMITELISVGTEILLGNIVNTNSAYLSEKCALLGLSVYYQDVVGDNEGRMRDVIRTALDRSDVVILTGGLRPDRG